MQEQKGVITSRSIMRNVPRESTAAVAARCYSAWAALALLFVFALIGGCGKERNFVENGEAANQNVNGLTPSGADQDPPRQSSQGNAEGQASGLPFAERDAGATGANACAGCAPLADLGNLCASNEECGSGFCASDVDGVQRCCDRACSGVVCERCSVEGVCGAVPVFAEECAEVACPADDVCRDFDQTIAAGKCAEVGRCSAVTDCAFSWTPVSRDGVACACSTDACGLRVTEGCTRSEDCGSVACRATATGASICCAQACEVGQVCRADGSGCEPEPVCADGELRCSNTSYQSCVQGQWVTQRECGALGCALALGGCRRDAGAACETTADCGEGACRMAAGGARVCCTAACDTACKRCADTGTSCQFLTDDAACGAVGCPADTTCRDFPASVTENRCIQGNCGSPDALCPFTSRNSGQSCSNTSVCDNVGNCSLSKKELGASCTSTSECLSGQCVDNVCCESACNGACMACRAGTGRCDVVPADDTRCSVVDCRVDPTCADSAMGNISTNRCQALGQCKTTSSCGITAFPRGTFCDDSLPPSLVPGSPFEPVAGGRAVARICDGSGNCIDPSVQCGASSCPVTDDTMCCGRTEASGGPATFTCEARANCPQASAGSFPLNTRAACDEHADCVEGDQCCWLFATVDNFVACRAAPTAAGCGFNGANSSAYQLCRSPAFSAPCPTGTQCVPSTIFPGWSMCQ
jgi:hypothetical protein